MKKIITIVLDGFGLNDNVHGNAIKQANMPNYNKLWDSFPHTSLGASESSVGLPTGFFGSSEIGHETIGAGRKFKQKLTIINDAIDEDELINDKEFMDVVNHVKENNSTIHLIGLLSDGGIHSHISYMLKMIGYLKSVDIEKLYFHIITDGRDTKVNVASNYIKELESAMQENELGEIASICGRYFAMDRDKKYERTKEYYNLIVNGVGLKTTKIHPAIEICYKKNITDEFLPPILINENGLIKENDGILWLNFRYDRANQILESLVREDFQEFPRVKFSNVSLVTMFPVDEDIPHEAIFEEDENGVTLGKYFSELNLMQARIAETEKYTYVTHILDLDEKLPNTDYFLIPSPKVATYDMTPEMGTREITNAVLKCLEKDYDFIFVNYAVPDMLGHTGNMEATIKGLEILDTCLGDIMESINNNFYTLFLLADHGNCDVMLDEENNPVTTHSINRVPFIITDPKVTIKSGDLCDVAPTILNYMDIAIPKEMKESKVLITKE